ncbi:MAG: hypothetical protein IPF47_19320 [Gemmatimonadetes bacterium]|nr:hypothetical protein [Gemmatimonadota bacterium]
MRAGGTTEGASLLPTDAIHPLGNRCGGGFAAAGEGTIARQLPHDQREPRLQRAHLVAERLGRGRYLVEGATHLVELLRCAVGELDGTGHRAPQFLQSLLEGPARGVIGHGDRCAGLGDDPERDRGA